MNRPSRIDFIDNLKIFLSLTVIAHHAGQPYGGSDGFWYVKDQLMPANLGPFFGVNAGFNMSLYFLISAFFIPVVFQKRGGAAYLKDRLRRLGIPLLVGFFVMIPFMMFFYYNHFRGYETMSFFDYYLKIYFGLSGEPSDWTGPSWPDLNFGHLWFIEHLLIYSVLYVLWKQIVKKGIIREGKIQFTASHASILSLVFLAAIATFIIRIWYPIDHWIGLFGFVQTELAHIPQYVTFVILGIGAAKNGWIRNIPKQVGKTWFGIGCILAILRFAGVVHSTDGGMSGASLFYSFYETILCFGLGIGLLELFNRKLNISSSFSKKLAGNTFTVYIIHMPVLMVLQYCLIKVPLSGYIKFGIVFVLGTILGHLISFFVIRRINFLSILFTGVDIPKKTIKQTV
ncbi:acyltransferase [Bacillus sp. M6-12]|uniref:acyltransferase family protein n=1 Tax=Bacillus sp. M6-12 TaxID=2054166 RepID=UPI000C763A36|nr:acyltransferase family protein [Bacillus sp. M6-12]PLS18003.1 acyltransferase [Bacillus sp. M6-12]